MSVGIVEVKVIRIYGAPEKTSFNDVTDPYVKLTIFDGVRPGESQKTTVRIDAGGEANFNERFTFNKRAEDSKLRVELFDKNLVRSDELLGSLDIDLEEMITNFPGGFVGKIELKSNNETNGVAEMEIKLIR